MSIVVFIIFFKKRYFAFFSLILQETGARGGGRLRRRDRGGLPRDLPGGREALQEGGEEDPQRAGRPQRLILADSHFTEKKSQILYI